MHTLAIHAHPGIPQMHTLAIHAHPGIPQVHKLALACFVLDNLPRPDRVRVTPTASYPAAQPPYPPTRDFGVIIIRVSLQQPGQGIATFPQPYVPGVQIVFIRWPVRIMRDLSRIVFHGAPEVGDKPIPVVDGLGPCHLWRPIRPFQQHCAGTEERLHVIWRVAKARPYLGRNFALPAKPRERGPESCHNHLSSTYFSPPPWRSGEGPGVGIYHATTTSPYPSGTRRISIESHSSTAFEKSAQRTSTHTWYCSIGAGRSLWKIGRA